MKTTIKVSESGEEAVIQMQPTVPIKCLPQFDETCKVTVELGHDTNWQDKKCVGKLCYHGDINGPRVEGILNAVYLCRWQHASDCVW